MIMFGTSFMEMCRSGILKEERKSKCQMEMYVSSQRKQAMTFGRNSKTMMGTVTLSKGSSRHGNLKRVQSLR